VLRCKEDVTGATGRVSCCQTGVPRDSVPWLSQAPKPRRTAVPATPPPGIPRRVAAAGPPAASAGAGRSIVRKLVFLPYSRPRV
jgi:hypothetical protein